MINYPAILVLCTAKLSTNFSCWPCVWFFELMGRIIWLLTGRVGWWFFWLWKIILLPSLLLWWNLSLIFRSQCKTINLRQSLSLFHVFLQNYLPFFLFFVWNHAIPHCTPSKVQWPDLSYTVTLRPGATELSISIDRWQVTLHISIVIVAIWQHAALFQKAKVTSQHYYILHSLAFSTFPCDWKNCWEKQYVKNLVEDFKEARQTQERERQFMVSQIYLHKRLRLIPQGFEIFLLDRPFSESVEVFHFVLFTWLEGVK